MSPPSPPPADLPERFEVLSVLGQGSFGRVLTAVPRDHVEAHATELLDLAGPERFRRLFGLTLAWLEALPPPRPEDPERMLADPAHREFLDRLAARFPARPSPLLSLEASLVSRLVLPRVPAMLRTLEVRIRSRPPASSMPRLFLARQQLLNRIEWRIPEAEADAMLEDAERLLGELGAPPHPWVRDGLARVLLKLRLRHVDEEDPTHRGGAEERLEASLRRLVRLYPAPAREEVAEVLGDLSRQLDLEEADREPGRPWPGWRPRSSFRAGPGHERPPRSRAPALKRGPGPGRPWPDTWLDAEEVRIDVRDLGGGVFMLTGQGGNMGLSVGEDGAFLIDDQFAPLSRAYPWPKTEAPPAPACTGTAGRMSLAELAASSASLVSGLGKGV